LRENIGGKKVGKEKNIVEEKLVGKKLMGKRLGIKSRRRKFAYNNLKNLYPLANKFLPDDSSAQMQEYLPLS
jgi:hypothetical protein